MDFSRKSLGALSFFLSLIIVAFGQPATSAYLGYLSYFCGFSLLFFSLEKLSSKQQLVRGFFWFFTVQLIQLAWFLTHPYNYIYIVYFFFALIWAVQFTIWIYCLFLKQKSLLQILSLSSIWTLFEWSRLFFLSGYSWNPIGLSATGSIYFLQMASIGGVFLLSFWMMSVNLLLFFRRFSLFVIMGVLPFIFGFIHVEWHKRPIKEHEIAHAFIVQNGQFPEESIGMSLHDLIGAALSEWNKAFKMLAPHYNKEQVNLILFPEGFVPFGVSAPIYPINQANQIIQSHFPHFSKDIYIKELSDEIFFTKNGVFVSNCYFSKVLNLLFQADVIIGLEHQGYNAAVHIPFNKQELSTYGKRVLIPLGEYIPFSSLKYFTKNYRVFDSFKRGKDPVLFQTDKGLFSPSICYEETFGHLMRENRLAGSSCLVSLTNDGWYPGNLLPRQHFYHARLRTVEGGYPLIRASSTGESAALDSLGQFVQRACENRLEQLVVAQVPLYSYKTLYTYFGDYLIVGVSLFFLGLFFQGKRLPKS